MEQKKGLVYSIGVGILILVAIGFFVSPLTGTLASQRASITFGRYNNQAISYIAGNYFAQEVEQAARTLGDQAGNEFLARLAWRQGFDAAVAHTALLREMARSGADISERALDRRIAQHPNFRGIDGFDAEAYRSLTTQSRARFRALQRELYLRETYIDDIGAGALLSGAEGDFFRDHALEERRIDFTVVVGGEVAEEDIGRYIADNAPTFERIRVAVIELEDSVRAARRVRAQIADDGSNFYEKRSEISATEALSIESESEWLFFSEVRDRYPGIAEEALEELRGLAAMRVSSLISFGVVDEGEEEGGALQQQGQAQAQQQHVIFLVEQRQAYDAAPQDDLYSYARNYLETRDSDFQRQLLRELMAARQALVAEAIDNAAEGEAVSLLDVGAGNNFEVERSDYFPLNYGNADLYAAVASDDNGYLDGLERNRDFLTRIFTLEEGELAEPISHRNNLILFQVSGVRSVDADDFGDFQDFYQAQLVGYTEETLDDILVQRDRIFDNFDAIYDEFIALPVSESADAGQ